MLGLTRDAPRFQPMTGFAEPAARRVWFFTQGDSDLARAIGGGAMAREVRPRLGGLARACITPSANRSAMASIV
jgi:hypothetical protein